MNSRQRLDFKGLASCSTLTIALAAGFLVSGLSLPSAAQTGDAGVSGMLRPATPLTPTDELIDQTIEVRRKFGFRHDPEFVRSLLTQPERYNALVGRVTGGHYATPAEVQELANRLRTQDEALELQRRFRDDPDFAGVYVDQRGTMRLGFAGGSEERASERLREAQEGAENPERMQLFRADRSMAELEDLQRRIVESIPELARSGIQVSEVSIDVQNNTVRVGVANLDPNKRSSLTSEFSGVELYERPLGVPDSRFDTSDPMRAGVAITSCTSAWKARDRNTSELVMLTAGHCAPDVSGTLGGPGAVFNQGSNPDGSLRLVGTSDQTTWMFPIVNPDGSRSGAAPVDALRAPFEVGSLPWLYAYDAGNSGGFDDGEQAPVSDADGTVVVGTAVCSAGRNSPGNQVGGANWKNCGTVSSVNVARVFLRTSGSPDTFTLQNANVADYVSIPGDSGAPVWRIAFDGSEFQAVAVGINTGGSGGESFSDIDRVENALNVDVVHF